LFRLNVKYLGRSGETYINKERGGKEERKRRRHEKKVKGKKEKGLKLIRSKQGRRQAQRGPAGIGGREKAWGGKNEMVKSL